MLPPSMTDCGTVASSPVSLRVPGVLPAGDADLRIGFSRVSLSWSPTDGRMSRRHDLFART
jgi:hypothetical protein